MAQQDNSLWTPPRHHMDVAAASKHVHWLELFYDLIHVVTIFILGGYLSQHLNVDGFLVFAGVFIALWFAWADTSVFNSLYISTDVWHRVIMSALIATVMVMGAAIPHITGKAWVFFATAFAINRALLAFLYYRIKRIASDTGCLSWEMFRNFAALALVFAVTAFLPKPLNYWVFGAGVVAIQLLYMLPKIGVLRYKRFVPRLGHMSERFALLTLIVLGEGFFKLVVTLADKGIYKVTPDVLFNFILGGTSIFIACWIYFDTVANKEPKNEQTTTLVAWWLAHLVLMLCGVMIGVALTGEVKIGIFEPFPTDYAAIGCFGLAGFIAALWVIQSVTQDSAIGLYASPGVHIFGIALAVVTYFIVPHVPSIVGNSLWCTALFSQIMLPLFRARQVQRSSYSA